MLTNFYKRVLPTFATSFITILLFSSTTLTAPSKIQLLSRKCVTNGYVTLGQKDVSIGREVYTSQFYMYADPANRPRVACDITKPQSAAFQTLELDMGIEDNAKNDTAMVAVFFNGKEVFSEAVKKGSIKKLSLNVHNVRSVAVEVSSYTNSFVYLVKAELLK